MKTFLSTLVLTAAFGSTAHAAPAYLDRADLNKDGVISKAEFSAAADIRFSETDTNRDNKISKEERQAHKSIKARERGEARFDKLDTNQDGMISQAEYNTNLETLMAKRKERVKASKAKKAEAGEKGSKRKNKRKHAKTMKNGRLNLDLNKDGFIDRAEHDATLNTRFEQMDKNNNGILEASELKKQKRSRRLKR